MHAREQIAQYISLVCLSLCLAYVVLSTVSGQAEHSVSSSAGMLKGRKSLRRALLAEHRIERKKDKARGRNCTCLILKE
jgi:hypothetical protein